MNHARASIWFGVCWKGPLVNKVPEPLQGRNWEALEDALFLDDIDIMSFRGFAVVESTLTVTTEDDPSDFVFNPLDLVNAPTEKWETKLRAALEKLGWKDPPKAEWHMTPLAAGI